MRGKNSGGQRHGPGAALGVRWANVSVIFPHWAKGSENHVAALMYDTSINGSICQETRPGHEHADHGFVSAPLSLTITRYFWHFKSKRNSDSLMQQRSSFHILWHSGWFDWTFVPLAFFLLQRLMCLWFSKAMLLWWFSDVPDAPEYLVLSEHKSKSVKLKWIPGNDHNSSTTGKKVESASAGVNMYSTLHTESVLLALNGIF